MTTPKHNLLGLTQSELSDMVEDMGEPRYRGTQLFRWIYARGAPEFSRMTDLSRTFREELEASACLEGLRAVAHQQSAHDGTTKFLFGLADGLKIESVLIPPATAFADRIASKEDEQRRLTLCVSTQVGCPLDCAFCATAAMGFFRNLTTGEIVDQILQVKRKTGKTITNVVFMGMGEPLMNYDNVMRAAEIIVQGLGIAARRVTVSTAGWADGIRRMGDEGRKVKLAVSLHSAVEATRARLMPITRRHPVDDLASALGYYFARTKRRVTLEYILFDGVNDTDEEVRRLVQFARRVPSKINVIPFHPIESANPTGIGATLRPSPRMPEIVQTLRAHHLTVMVRSNAGVDIDAACGQLAVKEQRADRARIRTPISGRSGVRQSNGLPPQSHSLRTAS